MHLEFKDILDYTQDTAEYLLIDTADIEPGKWGKAIKNLSMQDWFFPIHFPEEPLMPGVLMMEAVMELGTLVISTMRDKKKSRIFFHSCKNVKISGDGRPGDQLLITSELIKYRRGVASFTGSIFKEKKMIMKMDYVLVVDKEMLLEIK